MQVGQFLGLDQIATHQIQVVQEKVGIYGDVEIHDLAKNFSEWTVKSPVISAFRSEVVFFNPPAGFRSCGRMKLFLSQRMQQRHIRRAHRSDRESGDKYNLLTRLEAA